MKLTFDEKTQEFVVRLSRKEAREYTNEMEDYTGHIALGVPDDIYNALKNELEKK